MAENRQRDPRDVAKPSELARLAAAIEQGVRTIHMADPNGHVHGHPRGTSVCRTCVDPVSGHQEIWPCATVRLTRRLTRAVEGART